MAKILSFIGEFRVRMGRFLVSRGQEAVGICLMAASVFLTLVLLSYHASDPSLNRAGAPEVRNWLGPNGAAVADLLRQSVGYGAWGIVPGLAAFGWRHVRHVAAPRPLARFVFWCAGIVLMSVAAAVAPLHPAAHAPHAGGVLGQMLVVPLGVWADMLVGPHIAGPATLWLWGAAFLAAGLGVSFALAAAGWFGPFIRAAARILRAVLGLLSGLFIRREASSPHTGAEDGNPATRPVAFFRRRILGPPARVLNALMPLRAKADTPEDAPETMRAKPRKPIPVEKKRAPKQGVRAAKEAQDSLPLEAEAPFVLPPLRLLSEPRGRAPQKVSMDSLESNARLLETVLQDFGVKGEIGRVRPGPVVTLYELEPAAGIRSSRVVGLADDIARSMSAVSCRVATVPGHNVIGIELPNNSRETVFLREILDSEAFEKSNAKLPLTLGKDIGGDPVLSDLTKMPHLLVAGTTGSGKSVGINTMILSILYRLTPEECRLILVDPKMLELSVYDGIPHLLAPVVTEPKKAVAALKWAVQEMESRYRKMSKIGVRNIEGYNSRMAESLEKGETLSRQVQTGFDPDTGEAVFETEEIKPEKLPYIVIVIDEMADLMMVAGKEIEAAVQRLAQMARAAGVHLITATQRPSVDVITGTIKANFPSRISFQVTSKIDSRTVLGEMGAEQLLGMGDMLFMEGGGRIRRVHGPFVSDNEVEGLVKFLKKQGRPVYVEAVTQDSDHDDAADLIDGEGTGDSLYDQAVAIVTRDNRASTSYVQRRLQIGYNRAAGLIEKMEEEGVVSPPNHAGKREVLAGKH